MSHVIILAGSAKEANAYRRDANLPRGRAVHASSVRQIEGVVPSEVHTLPGFAKRRDNHAIKAALKRAARKYLNIRYVDIDDRGFVTDRTLEVAYRYDRLRDQAGEPVGYDGFGAPLYEHQPEDGDIDPVIQEIIDTVTPETLIAEQKAALAETQSLGSDDPADGTPARVKRRTRCKDCGALHLKTDPCEPAADPAFFG